MSGRHGIQHEAQCVACATLTLVVRQRVTNFSVESGSDGHRKRFKNSYFAELCSGSAEGSYLRLIDFCITQL